MSDDEIWAAGYASSPIPVDKATWTRWRREIEIHAHQHGLRLTGVFTDQLPAPGRPAEPGASPDSDPELRKLVGLIRERAHLKARHISVLLVPAVAHLAPFRDGTHDMVRSLLELHFGLRVEQVVTPLEHVQAESSTSQPRAFPDRPGTPGAGPLLDRSRFQQILLGTPRALIASGAADESAAAHRNPPAAGRAVMTGSCAFAGFQSPGFVAVESAAESSVDVRNSQ